MKFLFGALIAVSLTPSASAQGYLGFRNHLQDIDGVIIDAPVFDIDCQTRLFGSAFLAQYYAGPTPSSLAPTSPIIPFNTSGPGGYVSPTDGRVGNTAEDGQIFYVQMRAWPASGGSTYEAALASGGKYGFSNIVPEAVRIAPGPLEWPVGLQSFCLIAEPSPLAYFVLTISIAAAGKKIMLRRAR